jgi:hypothetical protein
MSSWSVEKNKLCNVFIHTGGSAKLFPCRVSAWSEDLVTYVRGDVSRDECARLLKRVRENRDLKIVKMP